MEQENLNNHKSSQIRDQEEEENLPEKGEKVSNNNFKNFKQQLILKYGALDQQALLQKLIESQIKNKKLSNRLTEMEPFKQRKLKSPNSLKTARLFEQFESQKFALKICYLGHLYDGMALQSETQNTIEQYLFKCMHTLSLIQTERPGSDYTRAGRTDKGVSAMGNVIALKLRTKNRKNNNLQQKNQSINHQNSQLSKDQKIEKELNYCQMLNSILPQDIRILACEPVSEEFNARYWCKERSYKYFFVKNNLNIELIKKAIKAFEGKHNFINYCKMNLCNTVNFQREIIKADLIKVASQVMYSKPEVLAEDRNEVYYFHFVGNSFLWHQIRFMSSVLFMVGQGTEPASIVEDLLNTQKYPCKPNYTMASEYPLILEDCLYDNLNFKPKVETIYKFCNTFHQIISKNTIQRTLIANCMQMAKRDLGVNVRITEEVFILGLLQNYKKTHKVNRKSIMLHKASGRGIQQVIKSLKGKKKQLYEKKAQKQADFQEKEKQRIQKQLILIEGHKTQK